MALLLLVAITAVFVMPQVIRTENGTLESVTHYILPTEPSTSCPVSDHSECCLLNEWAQVRSTQPRVVILRLLSGVHRILTDEELPSKSDIHSITLVGEYGRNDTKVMCSGSNQFNFSYIANIRISNITFISCALSRKYVVDDNRYKVNFLTASVTLFFNNSGNISIDSVTIVDGSIVILEDDAVHTIQPANSYSNISLTDVLISQQGIALLLNSHFWAYNVINGYQRKIAITHSTFIQSCIYLNANDHYLLTLQEVTLIGSNCLDLAIPSVFITWMYNVVLDNFTIRDNKYPLLFNIERAKQVNVQGFWKFHHNIGGIKLEVKFDILPGSIIEFINNTAPLGDSLFELTGITRIASSTIHFENNTAKFGAIFLILLSKDIDSKVVYSSTIFFKNNVSGRKVGTSMSAYLNQSSILLLTGGALSLSRSNFTFINNKALLSGGLTLVATDITLERDCSLRFENNAGGNGGAMALYKRAHFVIDAQIHGIGSRVIFQHNRANRRGGAIFVQEYDIFDHFMRITVPEEPYDGYQQKPNNVTMYFAENSAALAGNDIYGGWIDLTFKLYEEAHEIIELNFYRYDSHSVTSDPTRICMCVNSTPECSITQHSVITFPGKTVELELVAVGQREGIVPSFVLAELNPDQDATIHKTQNLQSVGRECTKLQYTVYSLKSIEHLKLTPDKTHSLLFEEEILQKHPEVSSLFKQLEIIFKLDDCPLGFELDILTEGCHCNPAITSHGLKCNTETFTVVREGLKWINATFDQLRVNQTNGIIIHDHCPYCRTESMDLLLEFPDFQCTYNHSGVLCGACKSGLSQALGSTVCRMCSNLWFLALIPSVLIIGILLIALIMILNLTVSVGTINGLIFYANVIRAAHSTFFPEDTDISRSVLSIFIAWLNLDLGIEVCLYDGLDAYVKTWLQFIFPSYIWSLVIAIIFASHYSTIASKLTKSNAVQVLATLILLTYTKLVRVIITVFTSTVITYPNGQIKRLWLYDGNVEFLHGKHLPLFITCLLLLVLILIPYTLSLFTIQWLQKISHLKVLLLVVKFKPLLDAYTGPYKDKHRYWTGLLLIVRVIILLIFSFNFSNNPAYNLLAIAVISFLLLAYLSIIGGVYKSRFLNALENLFIINTGLLSVAVLYHMKKNQSGLSATYVSASIAFTSFSTILLYHAIQELRSTRLGKKLKPALLSKFGFNFNKVHTYGQTVDSQIQTESVVTHTSIELNERLLN